MIYRSFNSFINKKTLPFWKGYIFKMKKAMYLNEVIFFYLTIKGGEANVK